MCMRGRVQPQCQSLSRVALAAATLIVMQLTTAFERAIAVLLLTGTLIPLVDPVKQALALLYLVSVIQCYSHTA